jgi:5-formyltetrahydrofolate cyclo-ligase
MDLPDSQDGTLRAWRNRTRAELVNARLQIDVVTLRRWRDTIEQRLLHYFADLAHGVIAFCWPIKNEYDARPLAKRLRERGAVTALPVVVAPRSPLTFRAWHPGVELVLGALDIPYPKDGKSVLPDTILAPMNGFDADGFRLGYGAGFFDRTLAALPRRPRTIGIAYEMARLATIRPQPYDIPMDFVVTERALYRRSNGALVEMPEP